MLVGSKPLYDGDATSLGALCVRKDSLVKLVRRERGGGCGAS